MRAKIILLLNTHPVVKMSTSSPDHVLFSCIRNVALEAARCNRWAHAPPLLEPARLEPVLCSEKPPRWEAHALQWRVTSTHCSWRQPEFSNKDPAAPKLNKQMNNTRNTATQKSQMLFHPTAAAAPVQRLSLETAPQQRYVSATCRLVCDLLGTSVLVYDYDSGDVAFNHLFLFSKWIINSVASNIHLTLWEK